MIRFEIDAWMWSRGPSRLLATLFALACLVPNGAEAKDECVGLVLGGGGARGGAHIGVLKVLERENIPICAIAGTSVGAIIGSLYAIGYSPDQIEAIISAIDWKDVLSDDPPRIDMPMRRKEEDFRYLLDFKLGIQNGRVTFPRGVVQGQKLNLLLRRLLLPAWKINDFDRLPIPFRCVGTDIGVGKGVVFNQGDLALAVRASMSVPGAFAPIRVDGRLMVDGGLYNNLPVDVVREMGATRVIVVDVSAPLLPEKELTSPFAISMQMVGMLMNERTEVVLEAMRPGDITIRPELGNLGSAAFDRATTGIGPGAAAAETVLDELRSLALSDKDYAAYKSSLPKLDFDTPLVEFVDVATNRSRTARYVEDRMIGVQAGPLDIPDIEQRVGEAYGQGSYERIVWKMVERDGLTGIEVLPVDKGWGPSSLGFALHLSDNFRGDSNFSLATEATFSGFNDTGGEWRNRVEFGQTTGLRSEFYQPWGKRGRWFVEPAVYYRAINQPFGDGDGDGTSAEYRLSELGAELETGAAIGNASQLSATLLRGRSNANLLVGLPPFPESVHESYAGISLKWITDTLDSADFPSSGQRNAIDLSAFRPVIGGSSNGETALWRWDNAFSRGRHNLLLGARAAVSWGSPGSFQSIYTLGGFTNLSGLGERELVGDQLAIVRAVYYRRFGDMSRLFSLPAYLGASIEAGNTWDLRSQIGVDPIIAGSIFVGLDSPLGPIFLGFGADDQGNNSVHLTFGSLLRP
ncbi:MAG TPA: patatin-like phospholipase family protein [Dokdonella sp.]|uniref:patatin-like phospholipase family protein n=1 Tax=Dokdonella sp. TaxID=2291710 RepID=UPI002D8034D0|nr:patatin-like phospholipase family protein [Dokdonella sp.]HET9033232.1 patatin-like phospholipase family protein [Dokdonella sp.]